MRVLLVSSLYAPHQLGGAEKVAQGLAEGLLYKGHDVRVLTTAPDGLAASRLVNGVEVRYLPVWNLYHPFAPGTRGGLRKAAFHLLDSWNPAMQRLVSREIAAFRPDVVNTHNITGLSPAVFRAAAQAGIPVAHTLHDQYLLCPKTTMYRGGNCARQCRSCLPYAALRNLSLPVDLMVGVSQFILDRHRACGALADGSDGLIIRNASPGVKPASIARAPGPLRFGYLGQVRETKGVHRLVEEFLDWNAPGAELLVAGRGDEEYLASLKQKTSHHPEIRWLGHVEPDAFLQSIDALVVPSLWHDTAPLVILEAFANGTPVIGSTRGGIPEFITLETGWTFDPDTPGELKSRLEACRREPHRLREMGLRARDFAASYTPERFISEYEAAFACVVLRKTRALVSGPR